MKTPPLFFDGIFKLWVFDVSHCRLLIRRDIRPPGQKRVDIVFNGVRGMQIGTFFDSVKINEMDAKDAAGSVAWYANLDEPGLRWFRIVSKGCDGYICADTVHSHEDDAELSEPSAIYEIGPLLVKLAVSSSWFRERYLAPVPKAS